jgi:hypothetical protein
VLYTLPKRALKSCHKLRLHGATTPQNFSYVCRLPTNHLYSTLYSLNLRFLLQVVLNRGRKQFHKKPPHHPLPSFNLTSRMGKDHTSVFLKCHPTTSYESWTPTHSTDPISSSTILLSTNHNQPESQKIATTTLPTNTVTTSKKVITY